MVGFYYLKSLKYNYTRPLHSKMHTATTHEVQEVIIKKLDELYIRMRNSKTLKLTEGQSVDYAAIHAPRRGISPYPLGAYTPPIIYRGPPCDEAMTIVGECPYIYR
jgi:hypothetical protein